MGGKGAAKNKSSVDLEIEDIYSKAGVVEKDAGMDSPVQYSNPMHDKEAVELSHSCNDTILQDHQYIYH